MGLPLAILIGSLASIGLYMFLVEPLWGLPVLEWLTPGILYRVKTKERLVALSFDDGPDAEFTPQVLEILERDGAKATFFLIGERAKRHPELVERIRAAGHEIGNHCWRDGTVLGHSRARFEEELERTGRTIGRSGEEETDLTQRPQREAHREHRDREKTEIAHAEGRARVPASGSDGSANPEIATPMTEKAASSRPSESLGTSRTPKGPTQKSAPATDKTSVKFFRAPGGVAWPWQLKLAKARGYTCVLGCAYPHDPMRPPVKYIQWLIEKNLVPGTIVILHDGIRDASRSVAALPRILAEGKRRGLQFVSIGELVDARGDGGGL